ncbi:hydroxyisourate hydrolase [Paenibacillus sp. strain BS8-2]
MSNEERLGGRITTHVLDTVLGEPAQGMEIMLYRMVGDTTELIAVSATNKDGRVDRPLLEGAEMVEGMYEISFKAGKYMTRQTRYTSKQSIWSDIPIVFKVEDAAGHYHVPLLLSPGGYSTYRGS